MLVIPKQTRKLENHESDESPEMQKTDWCASRNKLFPLAHLNIHLGLATPGIFEWHITTHSLFRHFTCFARRCSSVLSNIIELNHLHKTSVIWWADDIERFDGKTIKPQIETQHNRIWEWQETWRNIVFFQIQHLPKLDKVKLFGSLSKRSDRSFWYLRVIWRDVMRTPFIWHISVRLMALSRNPFYGIHNSHRKIESGYRLSFEISLMNSEDWHCRLIFS